MTELEEVRTERLVLRPIVREDPEGWHMRSVLLADDRRVIGRCGGNEASKGVARKLGMAYGRDVEFHGRWVQLHSLET